MPRPLLVALGVLALYLAAGFYLIHVEEGSWRAEKQAQARALAVHHAAAVERQLDRASVVAESMQSVIRHHHGEVRDFDSHSSDLLHSMDIASGLELAPQGLVRYVFPASRFASLRGTRVVRPDAAVNEDSSLPFLGGPLAVPSGQVLVLRQPVFLDHAQGDGAAWGYVSVYVELERLLTISGLAGIAAQSYRYRLELDGLGTVAGDPHIDARAVAVPLLFAGGRGTLHLAETDGKLTPDFIFYQAALLIVTGLGLSYLVYKMVLQPLRLRAEVAETNGALAEANARYHLVFDSIREVVFQLDAQGRLALLNPAWRELSGFSPDEALGRPLLDYVHPADLGLVRELLADSSALVERPCTRELRLRGRDNRVRWIELEIRIHQGGDRGSGGYSGLLRDITERKEADRLIHYQAHFDDLTGLPNRKLFLDRCGRAIAEALRYRRTLALMFVDLDRFKWINDYYGHAAGDQLLHEVAARLEGCVRKVDTVARLGGDEFVVLLNDINGALDAEIVARKILDALAAPFVVAGQQEYISGSIGITMCPDDGSEVSELLNNADHVMYQAKQSGRSEFRFFTADINEALQTRHRMATALREALDEDGLALHYQPVYTLDDASVVGIEALLRWDAPGFGRIDPAELVVLAEDTRLIDRLGEWVIDRACRDFVALGRLLPRLEYVAVNVSDRQFRMRGLARLGTLLAQHGLRHDQFSIDITESLLADDRDEVWAEVASLREAGVRIVVDDFGTGPSSLSHLGRLLPTAIKVRIADLAGAVPETSVAALIGSLIAMAHSMGIEVIAEGVEESRQEEMFRVLGSDYAQGYLFCAPGDVEEIAARLGAGTPRRSDRPEEV